MPICIKRNISSSQSFDKKNSNTYQLFNWAPRSGEPACEAYLVSISDIRERVGLCEPEKKLLDEILTKLDKTVLPLLDDFKKAMHWKDASKRADLHAHERVFVENVYAHALAISMSTSNKNSGKNSNNNNNNNNNNNSVTNQKQLKEFDKIDLCNGFVLVK